MTVTETIGELERQTSTAAPTTGDKLIGRALSEGYRSVLPHGVYPVALLFLDVPLEEIDVNVHPAKTEIRFRRNEAASC